MRVTIYDKNPGTGFSQWFLKTSWFLGCWIQKLFGKVDKYYGTTSGADAIEWLCKQPGTFTSIQYWGHGSPGSVWVSQKLLHIPSFVVLKDKVTPETVIWFRTCSTFQGASGHTFSKILSNLLNCIVAGHTRIIGPVQGGLHTRKPGTDPSWPVEEGELPKSWWPSHLTWGPHSIFCLTTKIPDGW